MKILVDENIPWMTVAELRILGHDVLDIRGTPDEGMPDQNLWPKCQQEGRLLITTDKGFAKYRNELHFGMIVVRLKQPNRIKIHQRVMQAMNLIAEDEWEGTLVVMRDTVQAVWKAKQ